jgi:hypothetical protein
MTTNFKAEIGKYYRSEWGGIFYKCAQTCWICIFWNPETPHTGRIETYPAIYGSLTLIQRPNFTIKLDQIVRYLKWF